MSHIENAVREAVEKGGYKNLTPTEIAIGAYDSRIFHDPLFWSALGRARGWTNDNGGDFRWKAGALMSHLMKGKDAESFFAAL